jgi:hypothetical protein
MPRQSAVSWMRVPSEVRVPSAEVHVFPRPNLAVVIGVLLGSALAAGAYLMLSSPSSDKGTVQTVSQPVATVVVQQPAPAAGTQDPTPSSTSRTPVRTTTTTRRTSTPSTTTSAPAPVQAPSSTTVAPTYPSRTSTSSPRPTHSDD